MPKTTKTTYNSENLNKALYEVCNGAKIRDTAKKYGIPKSTLHFKFKNPKHKSTFGPSPYLSSKEESCLETWIIELSKKGFPLKKEDLQRSVQKFLSDHPRQNPFKDNYPGEGWVRGFLKRHPTIGQRTSEGVTFSSACVSEADIRKWFAEIRQYFEETGLLEVFDNPKRVFNGDESGFQLCPKTGKVLSQKGVKNVYCVETSSSKDNMTVMFTFSAAGQCCPPMIVYDYQRIPHRVAEGIPSDWGVGRSENGWMTSELFFEYIANVFYPFIVKENVPLPVIYFLDGHKTHLSYEVSKLCSKLQIELVALYPNATRILQPADVAVFRPVKAAWKASVREWLNQNPDQVVTKVNFAEVLNMALQKSIKGETLINGFKVCGLVPFDPDAVDYTKCLPDNKKVDIETVHSIHTPCESDIITFSQFLNVIGPSKSTELRNIKDLDNIDDNLRILHNVFNSFAPAIPPTLVDQQPFFENRKNLVTSQTANQNDDVLFPPICEEEDTNTSLSPTMLQNFITQNDDFTQLEHVATEDKRRSPIKILQDISLTKQPDSNLSYGLCPITGIMIGIKSTSILTNFDLEKTPTKSPNTIRPHEDNTLNRIPVLSDVSPAFKICNSDFGSYLTLPKTPERKGKKEIKRMPFAITSAKYKTMYKEQAEQKELELREKEERKKNREEAKMKKENSEKEKKKNREEAKMKKENSKKENLKEKQKSKRKNATNACKICLKTTKVANRIQCDMCSSIFHVKCIPSKHQMHIPTDSQMDLFVCHSCYKEEENDEDDENCTYEPNNCDELNMSLEENSEELVHNLYEQYLNSKKS